jgi:hypothetical protein
MLNDNYLAGTYAIVIVKLCLSPSLNRNGGVNISLSDTPFLSGLQHNKNIPSVHLKYIYGYSDSRYPLPLPRLPPRLEFQCLILDPIP